MRILGLDYGTKTVGVAMSDALCITAQGVEIIRRTQENKLRRTYARIEELIGTYQIEKIVLGYPKHMNGDIGERAKAAEAFRAGLEVVLWDERLTTVAADRAMMEMGIRRENRKKYVDEIAATFILQSYLDYLAAKPRESAGTED